MRSAERSQSFGTILITKDRNWCLARTFAAFSASELVNYPLVIVNNGATIEDPKTILRDYSFDFHYIELSVNLGIVGARLYAHRVAKQQAWDHYCFLQDDFELKSAAPWVEDTLQFMREFKIDFCRLTSREAALGEDEHWVKGTLRIYCDAKSWNCSHVQVRKPERVGHTEFSLTDKHYCDWAHIMSASGSKLLFDLTPEQLEGPTVTDLLLGGRHFEAFNGAVKTEFDFAVKHWIAYALGLISCTGIIEDKSAWCGLFDHFTSASTTGYYDLPPKPDVALSQPIRFLPRILWYVRFINLTRRPDRRHALEQALASMGIRAERQPAIEPACAAGHFTVGAYGCKLSHLEVLRGARHRELPWVLVLEDDCCFHPDFLPFCEAVSRELWNIQWDILYFAAGTTSRIAEVGRSMDRITGTVFAHCYAVRRGAYDLLIAKLEASDNRPVDIIFEQDLHQAGLSVLCARNNVVGQYPGFSDIRNCYWPGNALDQNV